MMRTHEKIEMNTTAPSTSGPAPFKPIEHWPVATPADRFALGITKLLRWTADLCFRRHYMHRAVVLETVAAVPGMVGAMLQHLQSLRVMRGRPEMVKLLLEEAENERMHLMAFVALCQPKWYERLLILVSQGVFFNGFFLLYLTSASAAHRMIGYFEEEAVVSYTLFALAIERGEIANCEIPEFARDYWKLGRDARLRELVLAIRADEMNHRDVNHGLSEAVRESPLNNTHDKHHQFPQASLHSRDGTELRRHSGSVSLR